MVESKRSDNRSIDPLDSDLGETVSQKSKRMEAHRRQRHRNPWFGLGFMGLIGWSIAIPTLLGIWLGRVLDGKFTGSPSWTLTCLLAGLILGCINAAYWINTENSRQTSSQTGNHTSRQKNDRKEKPDDP